MTISLANPWRRVLFFVAALAVAGSVTLAAGKVWLGAYWHNSTQPDLWLRAANLEPGNAEYWRRLGLFEQWDFERGDPARAVQYLLGATQANPHSDALWMDLASAYETVGETVRARQAFQSAQASHPSSAEVAWRYGSFLLRQGDFAGASAEMRRALAKNPSLTAGAVSQCWKAGLSASGILEHVLPRDKIVYLSALDYFVDQHELDAALTVWGGLLDLKQTFPLPKALPLVDELIQQDRFEDAPRVWRQALEATGWPQDAAAGASLVFDGGFEHDLVNGGFGWRRQDVAGASFDFDTAVHRSGSRSLRVAFNDTGNVDFQYLRQIVAVEPRRRYRFAAYLRTDGISTDSGMRFQLYDVRRPEALQILTPNLVGTQPWTPVETELLTGPQTHWLAIVLRRLPSWHFDNKLRGTVWVDDVSLTPLVPSGEKSGSR